MNRFLMVSVLLFMWTLSVNAEKPKAEPIAGPDAGMRIVKTADGIEYAFRWCPAGSFTMGSPENEEGRGGRDGAEQGSAQERQRRVTLTKFWMLETEVTVGMWRSFVKATNYQTDSGTGGGGMYGVTEDGTMLLNSKACICHYV